jgi:hypothetical protein
MIAGRPASSFPAADEDYFKDMDNGVQLSADEVKGRNMWLVWSGGNDRFWDVMIKHAFGTFDLLKTISSAPGLKYSRDTRWNYFGVINEPCFDKPTAPDPKHFGLWLDQRRTDCPPDPFAGQAACAWQRSAAGWIILRRTYRDCRAKAVSQSRVRRGGAEAVGSGALLQGPELL